VDAGPTGLARWVLAAPHVRAVPIGNGGRRKVKGRSSNGLNRRVSSAIIGEPLDMSKYASAR